MRRGRMPGAVALTTIAITPILIALIALDIADGGVRRWFDTHAFTTDAATSILVLLITVLIVDRVVAFRQQRDRGLVMAAQAAIVARQARRTADLVTGALRSPDQREPAADELRTYMAMLLVSAPVLIEAPSARTFLEAAQRLGGVLSVAMERDEGRTAAGDGAAARIDAAVNATRTAVTPLLSVLDRAQLRAVDSGGDAPGDVGAAGAGDDSAAGPR